MKIINRSRYTLDHIRACVRIARPAGVSKFTILVKHGLRSRGRAFIASGYVIVQTPLIAKYPYRFTDRGAYLGNTCYNENEILINLIAHELRHIWQRDHKRGRVWGARGRFSEKDADAYALGVLRRWRRKV